ncbi:MAG: MFS transporter [Candidatus Heimdallarchaeota archaeon]|nr:MFS transporter [Candidatus Heimdallarchaeota archaeon]
MVDPFTSDFKLMIRLAIFNSLGFFFLDFLIPFIASTVIGASGSQMGVIFSIRTVGYLLLAPFVGSLADRFSKKGLILIGSIGRGLAYFLLYFSIVWSSMDFMIAGNLLLGLMAGFYWIPFDILVSFKSREENRSEAFGMRSASMGWGVLFGAIIGFGLMGYFSAVYPDKPLLIYSALVIYGVANIIGGVLFFVLIDEKSRCDDGLQLTSDISYITFLKSMPRKLLVGFTILLVVMFFASTNSSIAKPFILVYLTSVITDNPTIASSAYIPAGISSMLLAPYLGKLADRLDNRLIITVSAILGALLTYILIHTTSIVIFSILLVLDMTIGTVVGLLVTNILSNIDKENRGKVFGLTTISTDVGAIFGPIIGGILWDARGMRAPFIFSIIVELLLIPFYIYAIRKINT